MGQEMSDDKKPIKIWKIALNQPMSGLQKVPMSSTVIKCTKLEEGSEKLRFLSSTEYVIEVLR